MKLLTLSALLITSVFAQDHPIFRMSFSAGAAATVGTSPGVPIDFAASNVQRDGSVLRLKGNVEINTGDRTVQADEADYHWDTGTIEARGNVRLIESLPHR